LGANNGKGTAQGITIMQAIQTRTLPATNFLGYRIAAWAAAGRKVYSAESFDVNGEGKGIGDPHHQAAVRFATELDWLRDGTTISSGTLANGDGCHVLCRAIPAGLHGPCQKPMVAHYSPNGKWIGCPA